MAISGVSHITLVVADLAHSVAFYQGVLGGTLRSTSARSVYVSLGELWLCLEAGDVTPRDDDSHIALGCAAADFPDLAARIAAAARIWKDNTSAGPSLYFLDPDGHRLELHAGTLDDRLDHYRRHPEAGVTVRD